MLSLSYDPASVAPVVYNEQQYTVDKIAIVSPSIHLFNGVSLPAELIVTHQPVKGGHTLEVCVPMNISGDATNASRMVTEVIQKTAANAPSDGDSTHLNMSFNLQSVIPRKPFFTYTEGSADWIVFGELDSIPINTSTAETLTQIIKPYSVATSSVDLFYNAKGPTSGVSLGDGIYISCQPTGSSTEETAVEYEKTPTSTVDFASLWKNQLFQLFIAVVVGCLLFGLVFYGINSFYTFLSTDKPAQSLFM